VKKNIQLWKLVNVFEHLNQDGIYMTHPDTVAFSSILVPYLV
jgi:hypothetical protein